MDIHIDGSGEEGSGKHPTVDSLDTLRDNQPIISVVPGLSVSKGRRRFVRSDSTSPRHRSVCPLDGIAAQFGSPQSPTDHLMVAQKNPIVIDRETPLGTPWYLSFLLFFGFNLIFTRMYILKKVVTLMMKEVEKMAHHQRYSPFNFLPTLCTG